MKPLPSKPGTTQRRARCSGHASRAGQRGITLVEIMISLLLGLVLLGAATSIYLANRQAFRQVENMARLQENARTAFEIMARDLREAGGILCGNDLPTANVVQGSAWWRDFATGLRGYGSAEALPARAFGNGAGDRVNGTEAIVVWSGTLGVPSRIVSHDPSLARFQVNPTAHGLETGDVVLACDFGQAAIAQLSSASSGSAHIEHNAGAGPLPGNCRAALGLSAAPPHDCSTAGSNYTFAPGGLVSRLQAVAWYVGHNGRGGRSLYRVQLQTIAGNAATDAHEMIENVTDLDLFFLQRDPPPAAAPTAYTPLLAAAQTINWARVQAVRVAPVYASADRVGTDGQPIQHTLPFVVGLRNRLE